MEVSSTDTLAHYVPLEAAAGERKLLLQEDVFKLGPDLSHLEVIIRVNYNAVRANSIIRNSQFQRVCILPQSIINYEQSLGVYKWDGNIISTGVCNRRIDYQGKLGANLV